MADWTETVESWNSTAAERAAGYPCDGVIEGTNAALYRAVDVEAPVAVAFRWLCQLRAAPYSYDWIDNLGRRSPQALTPGLDALEVGQTVMSIFVLTSFAKDDHLTLRARSGGLFPPIAVTYAVRPREAGGSRYVVKLALRYEAGLWHGFWRRALPTLDWIMMRRQLLNLKRLAEATTLGENTRREASA